MITIGGRRKVVYLSKGRSVVITSEPSSYRALRERGQNHHLGRGRGRKSGRSPRPDSLIAQASCEFWSWHAPWLLRPVLGVYFYLHHIVDIHCRKAVSWEAQTRESVKFAANLIEHLVWAEGYSCSPLNLTSTEKALASRRRRGAPGSGSASPPPTVGRGCSKRPPSPRRCPESPNTSRLDLRGDPAQSRRPALGSCISFACTRAIQHSSPQVDTHDARNRDERMELPAKRGALNQAAPEHHPECVSGDTRKWHPIGAVRLDQNMPGTRHREAWKPNTLPSRIACAAQWRVAKRTQHETIPSGKHVHKKLGAR